MKTNESDFICPKCRQPIHPQELLIGSSCAECKDRKEEKRRAKEISFKSPPFMREKTLNEEERRK